MHCLKLPIKLIVGDLLAITAEIVVDERIREAAREVELTEFTATRKLRGGVILRPNFDTKRIRCGR